MITFLLFTEEYTSKLPKHNLLLLPLRATKKKRDKNKFRATNFSACLNFVQRRKQFDAITTGKGGKRDFKQSGRQRQGRLRLKNEFLPLIRI